MGLICFGERGLFMKIFACDGALWVARSGWHAQNEVMGVVFQGVLRHRYSGAGKSRRQNTIAARR